MYWKYSKKVSPPGVNKLTRGLGRIALSCLGAVLSIFPAQADFAVDISKNTVKIDANFHGDSIVVFGSKPHTNKIYIVFRGEKQNLLIHKKGKTYGMWHNKFPQKIDGIYKYYALYSSEKTDNITDANSSIFEEFEIGEDNIKVLNQIREDYKEFFLNYKKKGSLFSTEDSSVEVVGHFNLFKATINIPNDIPNGQYKLEVFNVAGDVVENIYIANVEVVKKGLSTFLEAMAKDHSFIYGILSVISALSLGFGSFVAFKWIGENML
jgi:uncharacterized protein (TIGR02186 family)